MKPNRWFSAIFFFASSIALAGCYTHLATNPRPASYDGYYTYHAARPAYSDTIRANPSLEKPLVTYDTTMHGDTMFIDEHRTEVAAQPGGVASNDGGSTTVNNIYGPGYYAPGGYWGGYGFYGPDWGFSIGSGWPYYQAWPYYDYSWYEPFGYAPFYYPNFYYPYYAFGGYPYYGGGYGYGYGDGGYYGHGFHHHGFHDHGFGGYGGGLGGNIRSGRIGGQYRAGSITAPITQPGKIGLAGRPNFANAAVSNTSVSNTSISNASRPATNLTRGGNSGFTVTNAADVLRSSADRNAPMHVVGPDASAALTRSASANVRGGTPIVINRTSAPATYNGAASTYNGTPSTYNRAASTYNGATSTYNRASSNGFANTASRPVIVRRMDGQTVTTSSQAGRQMVVVRRSAGYSPRGYSSSSHSYNSSSRGYSAPARSYSPPARSYSPPARSYSPPAQSYSAPAQSSGGGGGERSGGGGGGGGARGGGGGGGGGGRR